MSTVESQPVEESAAPTRVAAFAAGLVESAWTAALVAVPLYLNLHSERVFEEDKVPLLRSLSAVAAVGLIAWAVERGRHTRESILRAPLVAPTLALAAIYAASTLSSTTPVVSLFGGYHRLQGAYTFASYLPFFFAPIAIGIGLRRAERVVTAILFASVPVSLYALAQYAGYDPMPWGDTFQQRSYSTTGNPIFLGAYLILPMPLAIARLIDRAAASRTAALGYLSLLALQIAGLVVSQSRGPLIGLVVGLAVFGLVATVLWIRRRVLVLVLALAVAGALVGATLRVTSGKMRGLARLADVVNVEGGSGKVRALIWQAASDLIAESSPSRLLIGYGPESQLTALTPHYPPELGQYESRQVIPDRAHNEAIDTTIAIGILGSTAEFSLFIAFFLCVFRALGVIAGRQQGIFFAALLATGGILGALLPHALDGSFRYSGLGVHAGISGALLLFLAARAVVAPSVRPVRSADLLLACTGAAVAAHLVEIGLALAVTATRLQFWTYAGLAAALTSRSEEERSSAANRAAPAWIAALALMLIAVDFFTPSGKPAALAKLFAAVALPTWIAGAFLLPRAATGWRGRAAALGVYAAWSLAPSLAFAVLLFWWLGWQPPATADTAGLAVHFAHHVAHTVSITYAAVFALVVGAALALARPWPARLARSAGHAALYAGLVASAAAIAIANLSVSRADVIAKQATFYEKVRRFDLAAAVAEEASRMQPSVEQYHSNVGRAYIEQAKAEWWQDPARGRELMARGEAALLRARLELPQLLDHTRNLARLHRAWAELETDPSEKSLQRNRADSLYEQATVLAPTSAPLLNEWALMYLEMNDPPEAHRLLDRSLTVDDRYVTTYFVRANLRAAEGDLVGALGDYDRAIAIKPWELAALSGKGAVLMQLGRLDEAIAVNEKILQFKPKDTIGLRNLALLYREKGDTANALDFARRARAVAPSSERAGLDTFIAEVESGAHSSLAR